MAKVKEKKRAKRPAVKMAAPASPGAFTAGQRVMVVAPGSFAAGQAGRVTRGDAGAGQVGVLLDLKQAEKLFPAGDLAAA